MSIRSVPTFDRADNATGVRIRHLAILAGCLMACSDGTDPGLSLPGTWDFIGFSDAGVAATTTGTFTFTSSGTVSVIGTITFPGEPTDSIIEDGTYAVTGNTVSLTLGTTTTWSWAMNGNVLTMTALSPPPANTITLRRR